MDPDKNSEPSGETARMGEIPAMLRLARTVDEATSNTKTVRVLASWFTPMMVAPSGVA
jgi:hypothetical protein